jgi:hypothetical protein
LAITTNASVGEVRDTRCTIASVGATDRAISNSPMASPRWVTGAYHVLPVDVSGQHPLSAGGLLLWAAVEGHHHRDVLVLPTATGHGTDRDVDQTHRARPLMSATKNDTHDGPRITPMLRVTACTASTGAAFCTANCTSLRSVPLMSFLVKLRCPSPTSPGRAGPDCTRDIAGP